MKKIILLIIAITLFSCSSKKESAEASLPSFPVMNIASVTAITHQEYPASIEGIDNVEIRPQVNGALDQIFVDEGSLVHAGDPLFKINDELYRSQYNNALASLHVAEGSLANAQLEVEKLTPLVQSKVVSEYQLKAAKTAVLVAQANVEVAKANLSAAQINLDYTLIKAPVNGYIGRLMKKKGSLINPQDAEPLTVLSDNSIVHVYFAFGEQDFARFQSQYEGRTLSDKINSLPPVDLILANDSMYPLKGKVELIDGQFNKNTGAITVRASFQNQDGLLRTGNTGKIRLSLQQNNAIVIPQSSTMEMQDKIFVFAVADSNKVKKEIITVIGKIGSDYVVNGLKVGDRIVTDGTGNLQEGVIIQPIITPAKTANK